MVTKLKSEYRPLGVVFFLVVGGLVLGSLTIPKTGVIKQQVNINGSAFIPQAQGAEIDSAALTVQDAPFLASGNTDALSSSSISNPEVYYGDGATAAPSSPLL